MDQNTGWALNWEQFALALSQAYHMTDQHERELSVLREALLDAPSSRWLRALEVAALGILGRMEEFRAELAAAEQLAETPGFNTLRFYHLVGLELNAHGSTVEGKEVLGRAVGWMAAHLTPR